MTVLPIQQPPVNYSSQAAIGAKSILLDPAHDVWMLVAAGAPASGEGNGWAGVGSLVLDATNGKLYQQTGALAATVWTVFEAAAGGIVFSSQNAITAHAGGTKASAVALTNNISHITVCATLADSVLAPPATAGGFAIITNSGVAAAAVYGAGTDTINDVATATLTYLPAGQTMILSCPVAGKWYGSIATIAATSQATPAAPTAPASTSTYFMQGLAGAITPNKSGKVLVIVSGDMIGSTTTAGDGIDIQISHGTGAAPANAAALAGTQDGAIQGYRNPSTVTAADILVPFSTQAVITGLALGTPYWLDLAAKSIGTNSSVGLTNVSITAVEIG